MGRSSAGFSGGFFMSVAMVAGVYPGEFRPTVLTDSPARANRSGGTDRGQGGVVFRLGRSVGNGRVSGSWPGLARHQVSGPGDLAVTTNLRTVLDEVSLVRWARPVREPAAPAPSVSGRPGDSYLTK